MEMSERLSETSHRSWPAWILLAGLWAASIYVWILPIVRPRGYYLWGHHRLSDVFLGIPLGLATLCATTIAITPSKFRRHLALRLVTMCLAALTMGALLDLGYTFGVLKIWQPNMYLDLGAISRNYGRPDAELGFTRKPNLTWYGQATKDTKQVEFRTDENGFRNPPGARQADIVFIGDSYTDAPQVAENETFVRRVAEATGQSVVNLGLGATGPPQQLGILQRYGFSYNPHVVVWAIFEGNDLGDAQTFVQWQRERDKVHVSLLERYLKNSLITQFLSRTMAERPEPGSVLAKFRYTDGTVRGLYIKYPYASDQPEKKAVGMSEIEKDIENGYQLCRSRGIRLVVVFIPTMVRALAPYITFDRRSDHDRFLPNDVVENDKDFESRVHQVCARLGCSFVDGFRPLREAASVDNRDLYVPNDEHLNVRGHAIMAGEIVKALKSGTTLAMDSAQ